MQRGGREVSNFNDSVQSSNPQVIAEKLNVESTFTPRKDRLGRWFLPIFTMLMAIGLWQLIVVVYDIPHYILPSPVRVLQTLITDWSILFVALLNTLKITFGALLLATVGGLVFAIVFAQSKWIEISFFPFAVILQVTPIIAIAPLIFIYVDSITAGLLICAWIVAFFPILANTILGLNSVDQNLRNLFQLMGASRWQQLVYLRIPSALPYFLGGLKIAGGLALIGSIVAEFVAGTAGSGAGLATQILEASFRLNIPRMFAALLLVSLTGILIFMTLNLISYLLLRRWHESALKQEY